MSVPVLVLGTGGHAKVIIDILEHMGTFSVAGCVSADHKTPDFLGYPVLGRDEVVESVFKRGLRSAFIAIGDNRIRQEKTVWLRGLGFKIENVVSPDARISKRATIGTGVAIMPGAVINTGAAIGDGAIINTGALIDHDCSIGAFAHVAPGTVLAGAVEVGEGAFMGAGSRAIPRVSIGDWTIVGAGAVVLHPLPTGVTAVGVPARVLHRRAAQ